MINRKMLEAQRDKFLARFHAMQLELAPQLNDFQRESLADIDYDLRESDDLADIEGFVKYFGFKTADVWVDPQNRSVILAALTKLDAKYGQDFNSKMEFTEPCVSLELYDYVEHYLHGMPVTVSVK